MTVSPRDGFLYISDFQNKQVLRVTDVNPANTNLDINSNFQIIAGKHTYISLSKTSLTRLHLVFNSYTLVKIQFISVYQTGFTVES